MKEPKMYVCKFYRSRIPQVFQNPVHFLIPLFLLFCLFPLFYCVCLFYALGKLDCWVYFRIRRSGEFFCGCLPDSFRATAGVYTSSAFTQNQWSASIRSVNNTIENKTDKSSACFQDKGWLQKRVWQSVCVVLSFQHEISVTCVCTGCLSGSAGADRGRLPHEGVGWHGICRLCVREGASLQSHWPVWWCKSDYCLQNYVPSVLILLVKFLFFVDHIDSVEHANKPTV